MNKSKQPRVSRSGDSQKTSGNRKLRSEGRKQGGRNAEESARSERR